MAQIHACIRICSSSRPCFHQRLQTLERQDLVLYLMKLPCQLSPFCPYQSVVLFLDNFGWYFILESIDTMDVVSGTPSITFTCCHDFLNSNCFNRHRSLCPTNIVKFFPYSLRTPFFSILSSWSSSNGIRRFEIISCNFTRS